MLRFNRQEDLVHAAKPSMKLFENFRVPSFVMSPFVEEGCCAAYIDLWLLHCRHIQQYQ